MTVRSLLVGSVLGIMLLTGVSSAASAGRESPAQRVRNLLDRFRQVDWDSRAVGIRKGPLDDAWKTRLTVENGLLAVGKDGAPALMAACSDADRHVRCLAAYCLGLLNDRRAASVLERLVSSDQDPMVRLKAVEALGRLGAKEAAAVVRAAADSDDSVHVRNAAKWALPRVEAGKGVGDSLRRRAVKQFDANQLARAAVGQPAPDFTLPKGDGTPVSLHDFRGKRNVVLIFMLADW